MWGFSVSCRVHKPTQAHRPLCEASDELRVSMRSEADTDKEKAAALLTLCEMGHVLRQRMEGARGDG